MSKAGLRTDCKNCLKPMKPRVGKEFCGPKCRIAWWKNPRSAGKLRRQIEAIIGEVLPGYVDAVLKERARRLEGGR